MSTDFDDFEDNPFADEAMHDKPWLTDPLYGGMSPEAAEKSWRAKQEQVKQREDREGKAIERQTNGNGSLYDDAKSPTPLRFTWAKDLCLESKECLIDGVLGRYEVSVWYGPPDSGKSTVKVDALAHVAAGMAYCQRRVIQGSCLFVAAERGAISKRRILAWCHEHELPDIPLALIDSAIDLRTSSVDAERIIATAQEMEALHGQAVVWIAFDTLISVLAGGDENSPKDMGALIANVDRIHRATRAHCSLIHHVPLDRNDRMRGHGLVLGAVDTTIRVVKNDGVVCVEVDKANDLVDKPCLAFSFKSVFLDRDENTGVETTAPVAVFQQHQRASKPKAQGARMTKAARIAMRALQNAAEEVGTVPPASNHVPERARVVSFEQWRQYAYKIGISTGEERAQRAAFQRATEWLIAERRAGAWNGQAWPIAD
jgi:hypothetical protein